MKKMMGLFAMIVCMLYTLHAQEMIVNGTFESDEGWTIYDMDTNLPCNVDFGIDDGNGPAMGEGPYLEIYNEHDQYVNVLIWQELTLQAGTTYVLSGAFKDMTGGGLMNYWCELYLSTEAPVEDADYTPPAGGNTDDLMSFNTWNGCGPGVDGTFQDDACGDKSTEYTPPGDAGTDVTVYFGIKTGVYPDAGVVTLFDVALDNISLVVKDGTKVATRETQPFGYILYPAYPNPFNPSTTLRFSLTETNKTTLSVYDVNGELVTRLMHETLLPGTYSVKWDGRNTAGKQMPSGLYFCQFKSGPALETQRLILTK
jgi:hypothetical protein